MPPKYVHSVAPRKSREMKARLKRFKRIARNLPIIGELFSFRTYKGKKRIETEIMPATWGQILLIAFIYAVLVNFCKVIIYDAFGRPEYKFSDPAIEEEYQRRLEILHAQ